MTKLTLIDAVGSGKLFKRPSWDNWLIYDYRIDSFVWLNHPENKVFNPNKDDILAEDYELKEPRTLVTKEYWQWIIETNYLGEKQYKTSDWLTEEQVSKIYNFKIIGKDPNCIIPFVTKETIND